MRPANVFHHSLLLFIFVVTVTLTPLKAQHLETDPYHDFSSIDSTIEALYASISGEKGEARDWDTFRDLFVQDARLMPANTNNNGQSVVRTITPEQYIEQAGPWLLENGFIEKEIHRKTERFGPIAHIFSTYTSQHTEGGEIIDRGINSIQLFHDGSRWWVVTVYWAAETETDPIPEEYDH